MFGEFARAYSSMIQRILGYFDFLPLNLLLVRSHQAEIIIVKRLIQLRNNVTRVRVERRSCGEGYRKNDTSIFSAMQSLAIEVFFVSYTLSLS